MTVSKTALFFDDESKSTLLEFYIPVTPHEASLMSWSLVEKMVELNSHSLLVGFVGTAI